ncbi:MAG: hypothetical protein GY847_32150 [Proteobacteria bacterium]|nr:hypothetical protein [Pseudomonadota bacterium]
MEEPLSARPDGLRATKSRVRGQILQDSSRTPWKKVRRHHAAIGGLAGAAQADDGGTHPQRLAMGRRSRRSGLESAFLRREGRDAYE